MKTKIKTVLLAILFMVTAGMPAEARNHQKAPVCCECCECCECGIPKIPMPQPFSIIMLISLAVFFVSYAITYILSNSIPKSEKTDEKWWKYYIPIFKIITYITGILPFVIILYVYCTT
jgi:hypothetical protein